MVDAEQSAREAEERYARQGLHVSPTFEGMVRVDGNLDPECGQTVVTAVRAVVDDWCRMGIDDSRTPAQRPADALGEICRQWLDRSDRPVVAGERPHITVTVDLEALEGRAGRRCDLDEGGGSPRRPVAWPETPRWPGSSPGEDRSRSTWAAGPRRCRRGSAGPWA